MIRDLKLAMTQLKAAGARTIYINGSFVTSKETPNDFDACYDRETVDREYLKSMLLDCLLLRSKRPKAKVEGGDFSLRRTCRQLRSEFL